VSHSPTFERFVAPARARPQLWRTVLGLGVILLVYVLWMLFMAGGVWLAVGGASVEGALGEIGMGGDPVSLVLLLFTFTGMALGCFVAVRLLHARGAGTLFGRAPVVLRDFAVGAGILAGVAIVGGVPLLLSIDTDPGVELRVWLVFLPMALAGLLVQTAAEELVFRGYLQQQLAARFASPVVWMLLPSVLFGLVHYAPAEMGPNTWHVVLATGVFGLVAADLTARSGSLGLAWGLHFANNVFAILFVTMGGSLDGLALFRLPFGPDDTEAMRPLIYGDIAALALTWGLCRLWLRAR